MDNLCRVCLKSLDGIEFFNVAYELEAKHTILETLIAFANIEVENEDRMPKYICKNCKEKFADFIDFRNTIVSSDKYWKEIDASCTEKPEVKLELIKAEESCVIEESEDLNNVTVKIEPDCNNIDELFLETESVDIKEELEGENEALLNNEDPSCSESDNSDDYENLDYFNIQKKRGQSTFFSMPGPSLVPSSSTGSSVALKYQKELEESEDGFYERMETEQSIDFSRHGPSAVSSTSNANNVLKSESNVDGIVVNLGKFVEKSPKKIEPFSNSRAWTKKTGCPYCFQEVTHFPRHIKRHHMEEGAVRELHELSLNDPKRKGLLNAIRRQGNFVSNSTSNCIRPVRRPKADGDVDNLENANEKYVVCKDCLGYFKRSYLRRHRKQCSSRSNLAESDREHHLSTAQLFTVCSGAYSDFYSNLKLKKEVFPIMRSDEVARVAMNDILICCYAENLLRKHKRTQIRNSISNKMRELGRLLLCLKNITGLKKLFDFLKPQFFDNFVAATKVISGYDPKNHTFKTGSLALHMGTCLKQVCDIATKMVIKKSPLFPSSRPEETLKDIKYLKKLIETNWNWEISSLALKTVNENKHQKTKLLPLTQDVMKYQKFLNQEAQKASTALQANDQICISYRRLSECVLALTLMLNRKRIGEIQYLKLNRYIATVFENQQEEFSNALSYTEKMLLTKFKRVVTEGKGSIPVAILFPRDLQKYIEVLINQRQFCVKESNEYLFANPNTTNSPLSGYHTLTKLAQESGIQDPSLFTSSRLRKQIATIVQVLNLTEDEMEQLAGFMGHTRKTHETFYRLPQDIYQTAKVSKLLLAINSGKASLYKGKNLEEVDLSDIDMNSDAEEQTFYDEDINENVCTHQLRKKKNIKPEDQLGKKKNITQDDALQKDMLGKKKNMTKNKWTEEQKILIKKHFQTHIENKIAPKKAETQSFINNHKKLFENRNWVVVKAFVYNCYK